MQNNTTVSNVSSPTEPFQLTADDVSPPITPTSNFSTPSIPSKRKAPVEFQKKTNKNKPNSNDIDLLLANALYKENPKPPEEKKNSNKLFCESLIEIFDRLSKKKSQMAKIEILQILMKHEFEEED